MPLVSIVRNYSNYLMLDCETELRFPYLLEGEMRFRISTRIAFKRHYTKERNFISNTVKLQWLEHQWLVYRGWFEFAFESLRNSFDSSKKRKHLGDIVGIFTYFIMKMYVVFTSLNYPNLAPDLSLRLTLSGSNYLCLEQISIVPKMFESLKFDCI